MKKLRTVSILTFIFLMTLLVGLVFHDLLETLRVESFCQLKEGSDCYDEDWVMLPWWLSSAVGMVMAVFAIAISALFTKSSGSSYATVVYGLGVIIAAPFAAFAQSALAYIATVITGALALWISKRLTRPC